jgi:hypothetical protein
MTAPLSLDDLWTTVPPATHVFEPARLAGLPPPARRYLDHAIAPGTPLAAAVRLRMHGEIKLKGAWHPFTAEQVICRGRGMIWRATVRMYGMAVRGGDCFVDGQGAMRWKLFGLLPVVNAAGPDISHSAAGRMALELVWLPSALCAGDVSWTARDAAHLHAGFTLHQESAGVDYTIGDGGQLETVSMARWGNPEGGDFHYVRCGGLVEEEGCFAGHTIPTHLRVGWHFGSDRFEADGDFFHVTIDDAAYR